MLFKCHTQRVSQNKVRCQNGCAIESTLGFNNLEIIINILIISSWVSPWQGWSGSSAASGTTYVHMCHPTVYIHW